ncbi:hypothetical protein [Geobacter argillaceus]|uniref:Uncharacterized protein n=1 Tax=Geobacter argillaceus TaxID=345631 RepID=A0A562VN13_9BACT|nr:hypothetical protein [Geobacter argillaceus]TWJ19383.1 hypothetical protein JN12_01799 [Geobacter argillaceus]
MKRIISLVALMLIVTSGSAFAAAFTSGSTNTNGTGQSIYGGVDATTAAGTTAPMLGRLSKGVQFGAAFSNTTYAHTTKHSGGTKMYGTAQNSTAIYSQDATAIAAPSTSDANAFATGWTAM